MARSRRPPVKKELLAKSREAALNAVQTFNNPLTTFKSETFIVLMVIAWTYLLHAYYRGQGIEYRYYKQGPKRRKFERTKTGAFKYWELNRCLSVTACPLDKETKQNLLFLIGLRNRVEHHRGIAVDSWFSGRYLACCLNYERYLCQLFGMRYSLGKEVAITLQFRDLVDVPTPETRNPLPSDVARYLQEFDEQLPDEVLSSPHFRRRFQFTPLITNKRAQADQIIQFTSFDPQQDADISQEHQQLLLKEVERPKYLPSEIVALMTNDGYRDFTLYKHTKLWQSLDGKNPAKGFGYELGDRWFWYERWVDVVRQHCESNEVRDHQEQDEA